MQQFQANYPAKHGTKIPPPKRYMDEGDSEEEGLELDDGTVFGEKAPSVTKLKPPAKMGDTSRGARKGGKKGASKYAEAGGSGEAGRSGEAGGSGGAGAGGIGGGGNGGGDGGDPPKDPPEDPSKGKKRKRDDDDDDDDPEDDPNKKQKSDPPVRRGPRQKKGKSRGGKTGGGGKQPRARNWQYTGPCLAYQETYPPVDNTKPVFYINRTKQLTALGFVALEWT